METFGYVCTVLGAVVIFAGQQLAHRRLERRLTAAYERDLAVERQRAAGFEGECARLLEVNAGLRGKLYRLTDDAKPG